MSTTAVIVEMVIVGFQTLIWLTVTLYLIWQPDLASFAILKDYVLILVFAMTALSYTLGLTVDAVTAFLRDAYQRWFFSKARHDELTAHYRESRRLRQAVRLINADLFHQLDRDQYLIRLLRSNFFNAIMLAASFTGLIFREGHGNSLAGQATIGLLVLFVLASGYAYDRRGKRFISNRKHFYSEIAEHLKAQGAGKN